MKQVYIIGIGMGNPDTLTVEGKQKIEECDLLIGARRMVVGVESAAKEKRCFCEISPQRIVGILQREEYRRAGVLMSGDVGFYSGAKKLTELLRKDPQYRVECVAGISSVQYFCAKLAVAWEDAALISAHGRQIDPVKEVRAHSKTFFLTGNNLNAGEICSRLSEAGLGGALVSVGERLSYNDERIRCGTAKSLSREIFDDLAVMLVERSEGGIPRPSAVTFGYDDELFLRGNVPMTKAEVRSVILSKLRLTKTDTAYDVGAGTGSVSVEMALAARCGQVWAVEVNPEGVELIRQNAQAFGVTNLEVIQGAAPEALEALPVPDAAFIGGTKGNLGPILNHLMGKNPGIRIVISAIALETVTEALQRLKEHDMNDIEIVTINVARSRETGPYHMMMAQNPVYIISATGKKEVTP